MDSGIAAVIEAASEGDAIITLGAGSISQAGGAILEQLRGRK
jgi:UDP-N-acetylmuramate-alanine ligase